MNTKRFDVAEELKRVYEKMAVQEWEQFVVREQVQPSPFHVCLCPSAV